MMLVHWQVRPKITKSRIRKKKKSKTLYENHHLISEINRYGNRVKQQMFSTLIIISFAPIHRIWNSKANIPLMFKYHSNRNYKYHLHSVSLAIRRRTSARSCFVDNCLLYLRASSLLRQPWSGPLILCGFFV